MTMSEDIDTIVAKTLTPKAIQDAYGLIRPYVHVTPLLTSKTLDTIASTPQSPEALKGTPFEGQAPAKPNFRFFFKCENFQRVGAFKARGAFHALLRLIEDEDEEDIRKRGVITHSSGQSLTISRFPFFFFFFLDISIKHLLMD